MALKTVSVSLESAAMAVASADSEATLADASASLAQARVAAIIAGQDLQNAHSDAARPEIQTAELALARASLAIVLATAIISDSQADLQASSEDSAPGTTPATTPGTTPGATPGTKLSSRQPNPENQQASDGLGSDLDKGLDSGLDNVLNASITHFDKLISASRQQVLDATPPPSPASTIPQVMPILVGSPNSDTQPQSRNSPELIAADIPPPQADDIIAQQLWEAATLETNIERQGKLWEAYRRYRSGL